MKTLADLLAEGVAGRRVLVRADLNVPLDGETITDDGRVRASLPTIKALTGAGRPARIRRSSLICPSASGTLRSARTSTRRPSTPSDSRSSRVRIAGTG